MRSRQWHISTSGRLSLLEEEAKGTWAGLDRAAAATLLLPAMWHMSAVNFAK
jgi:hypothetical protein